MTEIIERLEKIEDEIQLLKYNSEFTNKFINSESQTNIEVSAALNEVKNFVIDTNEKINFLCDFVSKQSNIISIIQNTIEIQNESIKNLIKKL